MFKKIVLKIRFLLRLCHENRSIKRAGNLSPLKLVVGASGKCQPGWIETNVQNLNILREKDFARFFKKSSIDAILAEHVFEHLTIEEGQIAARNCFKFIKPGGYLRLAVPDGYFPTDEYIGQVKVGCHDHKVLYTYTIIEDLLQSCGFTVTLLEYWDEQHAFHSVPWDNKNGLIRRSRWNDPRNTKTEINYTSIIIDAVKG